MSKLNLLNFPCLPEALKYSSREGEIIIRNKYKLSTKNIRITLLRHVITIEKENQSNIHESNNIFRVG